MTTIQPVFPHATCHNPIIVRKEKDAIFTLFFFQKYKMVNIMLGVLFNITGIAVWRICGVGAVLNKKNKQSAQQRT